LVDIFKIQPVVEPIVENRTLAPLPNFSDIGDISKTIDQSMKWFDDHFGFRSLLIRVKNQIDFSVFGISNRVHIGKGGWLFYRSVIDEYEQKIEAMSDADMDNAVQLIAKLRDYLTARSIELVVITIQMNYRFYPEYLPASAQFAIKQHRFDDFKAKLSALPGITYMDTTPLLFQTKEKRPIFHKTNFHWNDPAAFEVAKVLVNHLADGENDPSLRWRLPLGIEKKPLSGGVARFMPLLFPFQEEEALFIAPIPPDQATPLVYERNVGPFEVVSHASQYSKKLLPPAVVLGDSFMDGVDRCGLPHHFESEYRAVIYQAPMNDILRAMPSDTRYFVFEFIEVALPYLNSILSFDPKVVEEKPKS
jgi:hypothetical protein